MTEASHPAIVATRLCKRYGHSPALDRLDLSVEVGQILGWLGPNGFGQVFSRLHGMPSARTKSLSSAARLLDGHEPP